MKVSTEGETLSAERELPPTSDAAGTELYSNLSQTEAEKLQKDSEQTLLHFGAPLHPDLIVSAKGSYIVSSSGKRILDWTSGQMSCLIGHGNPEIVRTIHEHAESLDHLFSPMISPPVVRLARRLIDLLPAGLDKTLFLSTGGESNEAAIKLAKLHTGKFEIVGLSRSWHGMTSGANAAQYFYRPPGYGPMPPGNLMIPSPNPYRSIFRHKDGSHDWQTELDYGFDLVDQQSVGSLAAVVIEPILSAAGMHPLPPGYIKALKQHCERRGMLMIVDEAQTALGRAGDMFAFQHDGDGVVPDILTLSKTLGNGLPLSAVVTSNLIAETAKTRNFVFYTTHLNDPLPAAVGDKVLEVVVRDGLVERSRQLGTQLQAGLHRLQSRYGCVGDVRGRGLMAGLEVIRDQTTKAPAPELGALLSAKMTELGLWANIVAAPSFAGTFRIAPPLTISEQELQKGLDIMEEAFASTPGTMPLYQ